MSDEPKCTRCGFPRREHDYNGACYGLCGEFVQTPTPPPTPDDKLLPCPFCDAPAHIEDGPTPMCGYKIHAACGPDCRVQPSVWAEYAHEAIAAWNTRAARSPTIGADDEASEAFLDNVIDGLTDETYLHKGIVRRYDDDLAALRRRIAGLLEERNRLIDELSYADLRVTNIEDRAEAAERELAACRDKAIEECAAVIDECLSDEHFARIIKGRFRMQSPFSALKTKETGNG